VILFDISRLNNKIFELEKIINEPNFWDDSQNSMKIVTEMKQLQKQVDEYTNLLNKINNIEELIKLVIEEKDAELENEIISDLQSLEIDVNKLEIKTLLSGKYDKNNAIITLHPGAGGTESQDWVEMLYRMYTKWANSNGYSIKELDYLEGEEAGIKSVTFSIIGENAYGYLKGEMGVHRLVRISPFDSGGRRHTSFASLEILPEITDDIIIDINPDELRIDTYRASRSWRTTY